MKLDFTSDEILAIAQPKEVRGTTRETVRGIASLNKAVPGDLSFLGNAKYKPEVVKTRGSVVLLPADFIGEPAGGQMFLLVPNPSVAFARLCSRFEQRLWPKPVAGIHPSAVIAASAQVSPSATVAPLCVIEDGARIGDRVRLQAQVFVGRNAIIGDDCWLMPGSTVSTECSLGHRVRLHAGVIIGSDGFGYEFTAGRHEKVPQVGNVVIEDDVEIGANSTLDRARFSSTVIGEGTKIDNLVQIAHNVTIGKHCLICAQAGISGSATVEDYVIVGGQAGLAGHLTVGKGSKIDGQSGINSDVPPGTSMKGTPALPYGLEQRGNVLRKPIPDLFKRVDALEERLK